MEIQFATSFSEDGPVPMVFCRAEGQPGTTYGDIFAVTVINTSHEGFELNVGRHGDTKSR